MPPLRLGQLTFSDGTQLDVPEQSIVVLVGPNNSGKSRALQDIHAFITNAQPADLAAIREIDIFKLIDDAGFRDWLEEHAHVYHPTGRGEQVTRPNASEFSLEEAERRWQNAPPFQQLAAFLVLWANTENRLGLATSANAIDVVEERPSAPLHALYIDSEKERQLSDAAERAFGTPITVNRAAGATIHLHAGGTGDIEGPRDATNNDYVAALRDLRRIQHEGDGVRSYIGVLLTIISAQFPIVLVDEPEAFLHPPQARQLGRELVQLAPMGDSQVVVATHSADFLQGALDDVNATITVVRLTREGDINHAAVLPPEDLRRLWGDPILRYSGLLDGLFHKGVVLCESDSDCRFYQATLDATLARDNGSAHDLLFSHTGGKDRLPAAITALKAINVDVQVVADIDVIANRSLLQKLIEGLGGSWDAAEQDCRIVGAAVDDMRTAPTINAVKEQMQEALDTLTGERLTREEGKRLRSVAKVDSGWTQLKLGGISALPQGQASEAAERLLTFLKTIGLLVVPVGELERWAPTIGGHGPKWVSAALEARVHENAGAHSDFVKQILG